MLSVALTFAIAAFTLGLAMNLWVVVRYTDLGDRILALDTMVINAISLVILYGIAFETVVFFEAAMLVAMVGFISTVAYCRYLLRSNIIE
ncbi:MAG: K+/H+ antiporter subunit F [Roseinatronobacter sp.]